MSDEADTAAETASGPAPGAVAARKCFVVMPFGNKQKVSTGEIIDFNAVYDRLIKPTVEGIRLEQNLVLRCERADEVTRSGLIHKDMVYDLLCSDLVVVDITTLNPNVLYELGLRHTARRSGTIIIRQADDLIPFNINGMRVISYGWSGGQPVAGNFKTELEAFVRSGLFDDSVDSLVHTLLPGLNVSVPERPIAERRSYVWRSPKAAATRLCIVTGDVMNVDCADTWVNPENTKLQMGRYYDSSISANIRYYGATKDRCGNVVRDTIYDELVRQAKSRGTVEAGTVIVTSGGELKSTNNVATIMHVVAQHGEPGRGYMTIRGYSDCIQRVLDAAEEWNASMASRLRLRAPIRRILVPLFGTRGDRDPREVAHNLVQSAKTYIETWPSSIERIYFLAFTDVDERLCLAAFQRLGLLYERREE